VLSCYIAQVASAKSTRRAVQRVARQLRPDDRRTSRPRCEKMPIASTSPILRAGWKSANV
jgi:hypothetical protein